MTVPGAWLNLRADILEEFRSFSGIESRAYPGRGFRVFGGKRKRKARIHVTAPAAAPAPNHCIECGANTARPKFCSHECGRKAAYARDLLRRQSIVSQYLERKAAMGGHTYQAPAAVSRRVVSARDKDACQLALNAACMAVANGRAWAARQCPEGYRIENEAGDTSFGMVRVTRDSVHVTIDWSE